jgi:hypothetical protein
MNILGGRSQALLLKELCPAKWKKSQISLQKNRAVKLLPTWQLMYVRSRLKLLNTLIAFTPPAVFPIYVIYSQRNLSPWAHSGFEPESPVHIRTWTWTAGNTTIWRIHDGDWEMPYELVYKATRTYLCGWTNVGTVRLTQKLQWDLDGARRKEGLHAGA